MRHFLSVLLALVLAPIIYISAGFSAVWFTEAATRGDTDVVKAMLGLGAALGAGALYAVLVMARLSPLGPLLAGLLFLGVDAWAIADRNGFASAVPGTVLGVNGVLHAAVPFGTSLLALPLVVTIFSPRRWRRGAPAPTFDYDGSPTYPPTPGSAAPTYGTPGIAAPSYTPTTSYAPTQGYQPIGFDGEEPTAHDAPSLSTTSPLYQPPSYPESAPSFPGFVTPTPPPGPDDDRPRFG
jgi:hypothetical protein